MNRSRAAALISALLLSIGLQYLWLHEDLDLFFHVWGFPILPSLLLPAVPVLIFLARKRRSDFISSVTSPGAGRYWFLATLLPLMAYAGIYLFTRAGGASLKNSEHLNALAISTALDLPVMYLWLLPILLAQEWTWRYVFHAGTGPVSIGRGLGSTLAWLIANAVLIHIAVGRYSWDTAALIVSACFCLGLFLFALQRRSSVYVSAWALILSAYGFLLFFENRISILGNILFGSDVTEVKGFLVLNRIEFLIPLLILSVSYLLFTLLVGRMKKGMKN